MATKNKYSAVFALVRHIQQFDSDYTYHDAVSDFTGGKFKNLTDIPDTQIPHLVKMLSTKAATPETTQVYTDDPRDKQRKAIIAIFKRKGKTVADAIAWAENRGVKGTKRKFNDYTGQELYQLTTAAEQWV